MKKLKEAEDNSLGAMLYQGRSLNQWVKEFNGRFSVDELLNFIRSGVDLGRIKFGLVDEADGIDDKALFKDEEFFFNESEGRTIKNVIKEDDDPEMVDETARQPEDVVTVEDFIELLNRDTKLTDKIMFRVHKKNGMLFAVNSRGGTTVVDIVPAMNENDKITNESITPSQWSEAASWFNKNGYEIEDDEVRLEKMTPQMDEFLFKVGMSPTGKDEIVNGQTGYDLYMSLKENKQMNEGRSWYGGGYGGTGKSWRRLGGKGPRGAEIGWFSVGELDPKAKGKMPGWRCGPSNFPFNDLFFPNRKYKVGTMVMRNKHVNAGDLSGELYIAIPSYFDIVNTKNPEGIAVLQNLGIPLDLTFGMDPNDDYSVTYSQMNEDINDVTEYSVTLSKFISQLQQMADKWGDDLLVKVVTPEPHHEYIDPKLTVNSKNGTNVIAIS